MKEDFDNLAAPMGEWGVIFRQFLRLAATRRSPPGGREVKRTESEGGFLEGGGDFPRPIFIYGGRVGLVVMMGFR